MRALQGLKLGTIEVEVENYCCVAVGYKTKVNMICTVCCKLIWYEALSDNPDHLVAYKKSANVAQLLHAFAALSTVDHLTNPWCTELNGQESLE